MRTAMILGLLTIAVSLPANAAASDDKEIKEKRVVRVMTSDGVDIEEGANFVFVGDDAEPLVVRSFFVHQGGYLGVQLVDLTPELRRHFGVPEDAGVMISALSEGGPAAKAGVEAGDIITAVDGEDVSSGSELARFVRQGSQGDLVNLEVWRDARVMTLSATLEERERPQVDVGQFLWQDGRRKPLKHMEVFLDDLPESVIRIDQEHMHKALGDLTARFESPEWQAKIKAMATERQGMEERIHELEARLRELEAKISKLAN